MSTSFNHWKRYLRSGLLFLCLCATATVFAQDTDADLVTAITANAEPRIVQRLESADGTQYVEVNVYPCTAVDGQELSYERMDLFDGSSDAGQLIVDRIVYCQGIGAYGLWVQKWSSNGEFLYFSDSREGTPDGMVLDWVPPVSRVNLADLQIEALGPALFSSDGEWLVTWDETAVQVIQSDAIDVTEFPLTPADLMVTKVVWLPDNSGLLYLQSDASYAGTQSAVTYIDLGTMAQSVLLPMG